MKTLFNYYIVDSVAESVVGGFQAPNGVMAKRIFSEMIDNNDKLKKYPDSYELRCEMHSVSVPETFQDVLDNTDVVK